MPQKLNVLSLNSNTVKVDMQQMPTLPISPLEQLNIVT